MICPGCGSDNVQIVSETRSEGKDFDLCLGICGYLCTGPLGILCGFCGDGRQTRTTNYWVCLHCGRKWKA